MKKFICLICCFCLLLTPSACKLGDSSKSSSDGAVSLQPLGKYPASPSAELYNINDLITLHNSGYGEFTNYLLHDYKRVDSYLTDEMINKNRDILLKGIAHANQYPLYWPTHNGKKMDLWFERKGRYGLEHRHAIAVSAHSTISYRYYCTDSEGNNWEIRYYHPIELETLSKDEYLTRYKNYDKGILETGEKILFSNIKDLDTGEQLQFTDLNDEPKRLSFKLWVEDLEIVCEIRYYGIVTKYNPFNVYSDSYYTNGHREPLNLGLEKIADPASATQK